MPSFKPNPLSCLFSVTGDPPTITLGIPRAAFEAMVKGDQKNFNLVAIGSNLKMVVVCAETQNECLEKIKRNTNQPVKDLRNPIEMIEHMQQIDKLNNEDFTEKGIN